MVNCMKVGIITYHRSYNFGSALQAYALNRFLRDNGIEAKTIDYQTKRQQDLYRIFEPCHSAIAIARNVQSLLYLNRLIIHKKRFDEFLQKYLPMTEKFTCQEGLSILNEQFNRFICGSDQIWNPNCIDFDDSYLLSFVKNKSDCIAYAPSIAASDIPDKWKKIFSEQLSGYRALSVREEKGAELIQALTKRNVETVLDPVFLLSDEEWSELAISPAKKPYIFCYFIGDIAGMRDYARRMKKIFGLPLVVVYKNLRDMLYGNQKEYSAGPREFLGFVKEAEYVCTNSFHAVAFSLIFKKEFVAFIDYSNPNTPRSRIENILGKFDMISHIVNKGGYISENISADYDNEFEARMHGMINTSKDFILKNI